MKTSNKKRRFARQTKDDVLPPNRKRQPDDKFPDNLKSESSQKPSRIVRRLVGIVLRVIFAVAITGGTVYSFLLVYKHATTSHYFAADEFIIKGTGRIGEAEVLKTAGITKGANIFKIDTERASWLLKEHPWIVEAEVSRRLPGRLEINIIERNAMATVNFDVPYLIDDSGEVFKRWVRGDPIPAPVITGLSRESFTDDANHVQEILRNAIALAERYRASGLQRLAPLDEIHWNSGDTFSLAMGKDPFYVHFGRGPYRNKLTRLAVLLSKLKRDGDRPLEIFFDNEIRPDRITVKVKTREIVNSDEDKSKNKNNLQKRLSKI